MAMSLSTLRIRSYDGAFAGNAGSSMTFPQERWFYLVEASAVPVRVHLFDEIVRFFD
jgi:hypothetical protein